MCKFTKEKRVSVKFIIFINVVDGRESPPQLLIKIFIKYDCCPKYFSK